MPVVVQIFDKMVDVPVVQLPQDVAVIMQRQVVSRTVEVRDGYPQCKLLCSLQVVDGGEGGFVVFPHFSRSSGLSRS